jgi:galactokinase
MMDFQQIFNASPKVEASAPGRVNLLGEHTDYNDGFVLPTAIPQQTKVSLGFSSDDRHHFYSQELEEQTDVAASDPTPEGFASYLFGCIGVLATQGISIPPLNVYVTSAVPIGSGLSSSAALEVAMLRGLRSLLNLIWTMFALPKLLSRQNANMQAFSAALWTKWRLVWQIPSTCCFWILDRSIANCYPFRLDQKSGD